MYGDAEFTVSEVRVIVEDPSTVGAGDGVDEVLYLN